MREQDTADQGERMLQGILAQAGSVPASVSGVEDLVRRYPALAAVTVADVEVAGEAGTVPARSYRTGGEPVAGIVWVHGGGFISGDLNMPEAEWIALELAARGIAVLSVDYRKALDGVHHPAPSNDLLAAWLRAATDEDVLGVPADGLHLGGASAGATLSTGVALRLVAGAGLVPASVVLVYPLLHAILPEARPEAAAAAAALPPELRFPPDFVRALNINYAGGVTELGDPIAFPANGDPTGLPPVLMINAEGDDLRASGEAYADQLVAAGVPITMSAEAGTAHGYLNVPGDAAAIRTIERIAQWVTAGGSVA
jgi:acetyl esterase